MPMEHYRPTIGSKKSGYYQGYYCGRCGAPGLSMMGRCTGYNTNYEKSGVCIANPLMVKKLVEANTVKAETKRKFVRSLQKGQGDHSSPRRYK